LKIWNSDIHVALPALTVVESLAMMDVVVVANNI
jgi:hypothetical protein